MSGLRLTLTGDWGKAMRGLHKARLKLPIAIDQAVRQEAEDARKQIIEGLRKQAPAGQQFMPLSKLSIAVRRARGFRGTKALIRSAAMLGSIAVRRVGKNMHFVGVLRGAQAADGRSFVAIARIHEEGATFVVRVTPKMRRFLMSTLRKAGVLRRRRKGLADDHEGAMVKRFIVVKIPPRPFIGPVIAKIRSNPAALRARMSKRVAKQLGYLLK